MVLRYTSPKWRGLVDFAAQNSNYKPTPGRFLVMQCLDWRAAIAAVMARSSLKHSKRFNRRPCFRGFHCTSSSRDWGTSLIKPS